MAFFLHIPGRRDFQPNIDGRPAYVSKRSTAVFVFFFFSKNHVIFPTQKDDRSYRGRFSKMTEALRLWFL